MTVWLSLMLAGASVVPTAALDLKLDLVCRGTSQTNDLYVGDAVTKSQQDAIEFHILGGAGRVKLPRLIGGAKEGDNVFKVFTASDQLITGKINYQGIGNAKVRLDRVSGILNISGPSGDFSGTCELLPEQGLPTKF